MNLRTAAAASILLLAGLGCGRAEEKARIDTAQEFCEALVTEGARVVDTCLGSTPEVAALEVAYEYGFSCRVLDGANVAYDAAAGEACLAALQGWSCTQFFWLGGPPADCYDAFDGVVADGGSCTSPWQCQSLLCEFDSCNVPGTCAPTAGRGEACEVEPEFLPCRIGSDCLDGTCVAWERPPAPMGEGADCTAAPCADAFRCDRSRQVPTCVSRTADGEACLGSSECRWGSACDGVGGATFCVPSRRPGEACEPGAQQCVNGAHCTEAGSCAAYPHVGGACGGTPVEEFRCIDGWCDAEGDGTCKTFLPLGASCTLPDQCGFDAGCVDGLCARVYCRTT